ncbi:unnamed protein product [Rotaria magnacalcarata]|uniref:NACHT domain-containing protein n=1 Tax=Rotaria magnacalcarata TaxID=392030 RepID=A0A816KLN6_9BILA|nr:unnamed protein product [Rotaria magnacalcarata]
MLRTDGQKVKFGLKYELVILIRLRSLTDSRYPRGKKYLPIDLVEKQYFQWDDGSNEVRQYFKEQCNKGRVLWILDGYDEFVQNIPEQLEDVFDHICQTQHHILTSRPYVIALHYDIKMEITGFIDENITKYIEQFFDQIKTESTDAFSNGQKLQEFLKSNPNIWGIAHIPVNLELICSLWGNADWTETKTMGMTALYNSIIIWLCRRYLARENPNLIKKQSRDQVYAECQQELSFLERLAFSAMESNSIIIPTTLLQKIKNHDDCSNVDFLQILNIGILKSYDDKAIGNAIHIEKQYYFIHLSFQEHFAARHLLKVLKSSNNESAIRYISCHKYNQRFLMVFIFATGLLTQSDYQSCNSLCWSVLEQEPLDLVGWRHIKLKIECFDEMSAQISSSSPTHHIEQIAKWMHFCVWATPYILTKHLLESLERTQSLIMDPYIQNKLIDLLNSQKPETIKKTLEIIPTLTGSKTPSPLFSTLCGMLQHEHNGFRYETYRALEGIGGKAATRELIDVFINAKKDTDMDIRGIASEALE